MLKVAKTWTARQESMGSFRTDILILFAELYKSFLKMTLMNIIEFLVSNILHNLVFMQNPVFTNNCWHKQIFESV